MSLLSGHWSPVGNIIYDNETKHYYALILDVNHTYGAWCVRLDELYESCYTKDDSNCFRGVVVLELDNDNIDKIYNDGINLNLLTESTETINNNIILDNINLDHDGYIIKQITLPSILGLTNDWW
eukprot:UN06043